MSTGLFDLFIAGRSNYKTAEKDRLVDRFLYGFLLFYV